MNLMEITKGYEPKQNEQTDQMKSLPDITDKWKQLAKEKQRELEKQLQSMKYQAEQNRRIAAKEIQKLNKRVELQLGK